MIEPVTINLRILSRDLGLPHEQVQTVVTLLDEGYPVPFIARYRKDVTGSLDEENILFIASKLRQARSLAERKQAILKAIESLGDLPPEIDKKIRDAQTLKQLEDLYLPYKPKKQTLANIVREHGLTELATEILDEKITPEKLDERAADFINEDKNIKSIADALLCAGHIIAETMAEKTDLIQKIRDLLRSDGKLVTRKIESKITQTNSTPSSSQIDADKNETQNNNNIEQTPQNKIESKSGTESEIETESESKTQIAENSNVDIIVTNNNVNVNEIKDSNVAESRESNNTEDEVAKIESGVEVEVEVEVKADSMAESEIESSVIESKSVDVTNDITAKFLELREAIVGEGITTAKSRIAAGKRKRLQKVKDDIIRKREELKIKEREYFERQFAEYFDYSCNAGNIPPHRILAFSRGEREKVLSVTIEIDENKIFESVRDLSVPKDHKFADFLSGCLKDSIHRILVPSLIFELRNDMADYAESYVVRVLTRNLRSFLLQPPLDQKRVLAIDPGFKRGCRVVALDEFGNVLGHETVYLSGGSERKSNSIKKLAEIIERYKISVIAIGNGTNRRETEITVSMLISEYFANKDVSYAIVNETGTGMYAISPVAREEFPNYDSSLRGAISIGRRLQNPLNELVKVDPERLGVGVYQNDVKMKRLRESLGGIIESCVNFVGVDINSATPSLLRYVAGLNKFTARRIYDYRLENGHFRSRDEILKISGIGGIAFAGCAGFLRVYGGVNPLDETWIHPESYSVTVNLIGKFGFVLDDLKSAEKRRELTNKINAANIQEIAAKYAIEFGVGVTTVVDILTELTQWGRDPREFLPKLIFKKGVLKFEDLRVGMEFVGTVSNVVEFGAFVDIGLHDPGLVHISQLSDQYIREAFDKVAVGDIVNVWVTELDNKKRRISLTMLPPGTVREAKCGNITDGGTTAATGIEGEKGERRQRPLPRREPRVRTDSPNRTSERSSRIRTTDNVSVKPIDGHSAEVGVSRSVQVRRNSLVAPRGQRDQKTNSNVQDRSHLAGRTTKPPISQNNSTSTRSTVAGRNFRQDENRNRERGQDRTSRFNRGTHSVEAGEKRPKTYVAVSKPKELKPITEKMKQGKEPLRSFGDLAQLWGRVQVADTDDPKKQKK
ncbi:MAG: helix-hairpin-helix domain-containing protein [Planctomycetaceae bacterium]|jgi:transcriptional accessory protein Tex/SPT6|nr:helix-hairpin-helix domain-containing protein [Planctomycetaceae bacterium]